MLKIWPSRSWIYCDMFQELWSKKAAVFVREWGQAPPDEHTLHILNKRGFPEQYALEFASFNTMMTSDQKKILLQVSEVIDNEQILKVWPYINIYEHQYIWTSMLSSLSSPIICIIIRFRCISPSHGLRNDWWLTRSRKGKIKFDDDDNDFGQRHQARRQGLKDLLEVGSQTWW